MSRTPKRSTVSNAFLARYPVTLTGTPDRGRIVTLEQPCPSPGDLACARFEGDKVEEVEAPRDGHAGVHGGHCAPPNRRGHGDVTLAGRAVMRVNRMTSIATRCARASAAARHLFALAPVCSAKRSPVLGGSLNVPLLFRMNK